MIPISCLTEFPNVVQMAKVSHRIYSQETVFHYMFKMRKTEYIFHLQLVCEEVNVDRFYPVLYPKVGTSPHYDFSKYHFLSCYLLSTNTTSP